MTTSGPLAVREGIVVEQVEDDVLLYDERRDTAHRLNKTAAIVWRSCDGRRGVDELVAVLRTEVGDVASEDLVCVALDDLAGNELIEGYPRRDRDAARLSRRRFIRSVGVVGAAAAILPVVHSILAPEPAHAQTATCGTCTSCTCATCGCATCATCACGTCTCTCATCACGSCF